MNERISGFLQQRVDANDFPSAVYLVAEKGDIVFHDALGYAVVEPERIEAKLDTIYDLASLTKPLVTGLLTAQMLENGEIAIGSRIGDKHIVFGDEAVSRLTIGELVSHTSGLPAWKPFYLLAKSASPHDVGALIRQQELNSRGTVVEYSDLNFIALGVLIENVGPDGGLEHAIPNELGLKRTVFNPLQKGFARHEIAATEKGNQYEKKTCLEQGYLADEAIRDLNSPLRSELIWGEVHDGNAWFMGGVAGHAGLFATAEEVFTIALQFLPNHTRLLERETCKLFRTSLTKGLNEDRSFAFQLASTESSTAGTKMPPESFGHNGFTGTSLWIDPVNERIFVLLTNRTHNHPLPFVNINSVRRQFHDISIEELDARRKS